MIAAEAKGTTGLVQAGTEGASGRVAWRTRQTALTHRVMNVTHCYLESALPVARRKFLMPVKLSLMAVGGQDQVRRHGFHQFPRWASGSGYSQDP
jgi:hypothetical protein